MTEAYNELLTVVNGLRRDLATEQTMHTAWRKRAEEAEAAIEQARQWQLAVDHMLSGWYSTADSYATPHEAIKALIAFEVTAALDPKVSSDAEALVERGRREEREACAKVCDDLSTTGEDNWSITRSKAFFDAARAIRARGEEK